MKISKMKTLVANSNVKAFAKPFCLCAVFLLCAISFKITAAEMRTYAYTDLLSSIEAKNGKSVTNTLGTPGIPGVYFSWPRTKVRIDIHLVVEQQVRGKIEMDGDKEKKVPQSTNYLVQLDASSQNLMTVTTEEDPRLQFYISQVGGFFTDTKNSKVQFIENSSRLSEVGVEYEDKTGKFISGVVKLAAEAFGLAAGTQVPKSTEQTYFERSTVEGISHRFIGDFFVSEETPDTTNSIKHEYKLDNDGSLNTQLLKRLEIKDKQLLEETTAEVIVAATASIQKLNASELVSSASASEKRLGKRIHYFTGIPYRIPGACSIFLYFNNGTGRNAVAEFQTRLPEAGAVGWLEFKSKTFATMTPGAVFDSAGGLKSASFAKTASADAVLEAMQQTKEAVSSALEASSKADKAKSDSASTAKTDEATRQNNEATRQYKIRSAEIDISDLQVEITGLEAKITSLTKPEEAEAREKLEVELRTKKKEVELAKIRLDWLKKGVEIKS